MNLNEGESLEAERSAGDSPAMEQNHSMVFSSTPTVSRPDSNRQSVTDNGGASDRKRSRRAMADDGALDDIMGQITSKLTTLSTNEHTEENSINAFVDVLNCSRTEAEFYLESSNWNVETAVMLWLENNPTSYSSANHIFGGGTYSELPFYPGMMSGAVSSNTFQRPRSQPRYRARTVTIQDLPSEWTARVSKHTGYVYFVHNATGATQYCVPTGYADLSGGTGSSQSDALDLSGDQVPNNTDEDNDDMEEDSKEGSMEAVRIEPVSPVADAHSFSMMANTAAHSRPRRSGQKSNSNATHTHQSTTNNDNSNKRSAFRDAMDEYHSDNSVNSGNTASSSKAVWDEGSGYSLNDPAYSVSSTTTNNSSADENSVFGHMASHSRSTFTSTNTNTANPAHFAQSMHSNSTLSSTTTTSPNQPYYFNDNSTTSPGDYVTQEPSPSENNYQFTGTNRGIAMESAPTRSDDDNMRYLIGSPSGAYDSGDDNSTA